MIRIFSTPPIYSTRAERSCILLERIKKALRVRIVLFFELQLLSSYHIPKGHTPILAESTYDRLEPFILRSPAFRSIEEWITNNSRYQIAPPQPLHPASSIRMNFDIVKRAHRGKHTRYRRTSRHTKSHQATFVSLSIARQRSTAIKSINSPSKN